MVSKLQCFVALTFGLVAVLYQIDTDTETWEAKQMATIYATPEQMERFLLNPDTVEKWFQWVSIFKAADSRPVGVGKKYQAIYNLPIFGEYVMLMRVIEYKPKRLLILESESLLKPRFSVSLQEDTPKSSRLTFKLRYKRSSALFQWTVGPFLWFLTGQQLQHSLFMLRMMFPF
ncbi:uncharacterized protein LOC134782508 [Penaeus indicus]|uniref:uncharacterized protein LOC134782508 n=1 Tax=Penaeus indicus TaxID=29960 RepID=UPI00300C894C